ncbi:MAG: M20/M25/M40 family metallo-hydrolase [Bacteroidales bacterium]
MKKLVTILILCGILCFWKDISAQSASKTQNDTIVKKIIAVAEQDNKTMELLDVLCNRFGGRPLGSDAYNNAADWCVYMFKKWGLNAYKEEVGQLNVGFNRGPWFGKMLGENGMTLHFTTPSYTAGTKGIQRGTVVKEPKTRAQFEQMKGTINGAWVLIGGKSSGWPIDYSAKGDIRRAEIIAKNEEIAKKNFLIRKYNDSIRGQRNIIKREIRENPKTKAKNEVKLGALKDKDYLPLIEEPALFYKEMREAGMLGIIQSAFSPITTLYDRKNIETMTWETLPTIPDIKLDEVQYNIIADIVNKREYCQLEFDIRNHFKMGPVKYHNVIAVIKGSEFPNEYLLCGGHLDAFDVATGAVDCGTGVAPTMEAARLLATAGAKPKRSIMFCLWAGEEYGLWGSKFWVQHNQDKLPKIVNYFNRDGGPTVANSLSVPKAWYDNLVNVCDPLVNLNKEFPFTLKISKGYPYDIPVEEGGTDHAYFAMNGVPTIGFGTGDPLGYNFSYGEIWHTDRDLYNKSIPEYMNHTSVVNAIVLWGIANLNYKLPADAVYNFPKK